METTPDLFTNQKKVQLLALAYKNMKITERMEEPWRFKVSRSLASQCQRSDSSKPNKKPRAEGAGTMMCSEPIDETLLNDDVITIQPKQQTL
ncbi:unnamed protein product [Schistosoma mattheei]|nr:unnamed protein product [Schistosoma mattheei]